MSLDIFFPSDIRNALMAASSAATSTAKCFAEALTRNQEVHPMETVAEMRGYQKGYEAALTTMALAFGLSSVEIDKSREIE